MGITLDGKTLDIRGDFGDDESAIATLYSEWDAGLKQRADVDGTADEWTVTRCYEKGFTWSNSKVKSFKDTMKAGTAVTFVVVLDTETLVNATVKILDVRLRIPMGPGEAQRYVEYDIRLRRVDP